MTRKSMEWEKIFADHIHNKGLIYTTYRNSMSLAIKTTQKMGEGTEQTFIQGIHMTGQ